MSQRQSKLLWIRDLIEHMAHCHEQLSFVSEGPGNRFLTEALMNDLIQCRRLCEELQPRQAARQSA
jgi:hypothetical protein